MKMWLLVKNLLFWNNGFVNLCPKGRASELKMYIIKWKVQAFDTFFFEVLKVHNKCYTCTRTVALKLHINKTLKIIIVQYIWNKQKKSVLYSPNTLAYFSFKQCLIRHNNKALGCGTRECTVHLKWPQVQKINQCALLAKYTHSCLWIFKNRWMHLSMLIYDN